ncbi:hypothetical protein TNCV_596111 [Trichonephila clavipes]|nr:hypothetical protein TNCV_596111 [Trichonephila clavipes]
MTTPGSSFNPTPLDHEVNLGVSTKAKMGETPDKDGKQSSPKKIFVAKPYGTRKNRNTKTQVNRLPRKAYYNYHCQKLEKSDQEQDSLEWNS